MSYDHQTTDSKGDVTINKQRIFSKIRAVSFSLRCLGYSTPKVLISSQVLDLEVRQIVTAGTQHQNGADTTSFCRCELGGLCTSSHGSSCPLFIEIHLTPAGTER